MGCFLVTFDGRCYPAAPSAEFRPQKKLRESLFSHLGLQIFGFQIPLVNPSQNEYSWLSKAFGTIVISCSKCTLPDSHITTLQHMQESI